MKNDTNVIMLIVVVIVFTLGFFSGTIYEQKKLNQEGFSIQGNGWKIETRPEKNFTNENFSVE